jgi:hypothetical protein
LQISRFCGKIPGIFGIFECFINKPDYRLNGRLRVSCHNSRGKEPGIITLIWVNIRSLNAFGGNFTTKSNGKLKKITKIEAAVHQLANKAAAGDVKAIDKLIALHERYGPEEHSTLPTAEETKVNLETLQNYLAMQKFGEDLNDEEQGDDSI